MSIQYEVEQLADSYGVADSFPKDFGYGEEEADIEDSPAPSDSKPRILLMGLRRSGKSSIQKVGRGGGGDVGPLALLGGLTPVNGSLAKQANDVTCA